MLRILMLISLVLPLCSLQAATVDHKQWDDLLKQHVRVLQGGAVTQVDYGGLQAKRAELANYLQSLAMVKRSEFDSWDLDRQLAFLINAYNSWTVDLILTRFPNLDSIKDLGTFFQSPWQRRFIPLLGKERSLDEIEHELIRGSGRYNDPRIHFAVNCASIGCPALRAEAYRAKELQRQLAEATRLFMMDRSRNRMVGGILEVSKIFKWYSEDFTKGWRGVQSLNEFFADHAADLGLTAGEKKQLLKGRIVIRYL
ncbi:MAG: DUF547 domain-containing protein, partial [Desulforhopalus sp.]